MKNIKHISVTILLVVLTAYFVGPVNLTAESKIEEKVNPVADVRLGSNGITFSPKVSYSQLVLTVSTPIGEVVTKTFDAGSTPYFELSGNEGDGSFTYELRVIPFSTKKQRESEGNAGLEISRTASDRHEPLVQSGAFYVDRGSIVTSTEQAEIGIAQPLDQVFLDDLIVTGSACIGFDCVNGESFGFDTLRLKENNLRIKFEDTSNSGSFPSNDWQITANDSSNGGANKFSIDDIDGGRTPFTIEASAPSNSLYVDDGGRIGLGTSTPVVELHVKDGDTPTLRLEQDGSSGFTAQTWDLAGNETNFFVRDVTNGSKLPFRVRPTAPTNSLYINTDGKIGFGTDSPGFPIHLLTNSSTNAAIVAQRTSGVSTFISSTATFGQFGTVTDHPTRILVNSAWKLQLNSDNSLSMASGATCTTGGVWTNASSRALKENIQSLGTEEAFNTLNGLNPVKYNYKADKAEKHVGFIAEDVPELVAATDRKGLSPMDVVAVLTKVVQEQQNTIAELKKEINELKKK